MSATTVISRLDQIQARIGTIQAGGLPVRATGGVSAPPAPPTTAPASFAAALATASAVDTTPSTAPPAALGAGAAGGVGRVPYAAEIDAAAARYGLDPALLAGLIRQESGFDPNARSGAGAVGLTQLMPGTAAALGVADPTDPAQSIDGGARYLRQMLDRFGGDPIKALAAYNAGPGAVERSGGVPPYSETQTYVQRVLGYANEARLSTRW